MTSLYRLNSDVLFRILPFTTHEAIVVRQNGPEVLVLNQVAGKIVELIDRGNPLDQIVDALHAQFDVSKEILETEVPGFIAELHRAAIVTEVPPAPL